MSNDPNDKLDIYDFADDGEDKPKNAGGNNPEIYGFVEDNHPKPPRSARTQTAIPGPNSPAIPCSKCGYNLRGSRMQVCPECGKPFTISKLLSNTSQYKVNVWRDVYREPVIWILAGLTMGYSVMGYEAGIPGAIAFTVISAFLVITGWVVFLICSCIWIGFDQPLHTTAVQLSGAYVGYAGVSTLLGLVDFPIFPWLISIITLVILLQRLLDIDTNDAILIAFFVGVAKWLVVMTAVAMMLGSL